MKTTPVKCALAAVVLLSTLNPQLSATPMGTAFNYQGQLTDGGQPANGSYDLKFILYGDASGGTAVGGPITNTAVAVSNGLFTAALDFGSGVFTGDARWLEIAVRTNGSAADFTPLSPRQPLTPVPYAIMANSASNLLGVLPAGSVGAVQLANGAVGNAALAPSAVTSDKIAANQVVKSLNALKEDVTLAAGANVALATNGNTLQISATGGGSSGWNLAGNSGTTSANFLGTTDAQPLELKVNAQRALRLAPNGTATPNVIGGFRSNLVAAGVSGATIAGGGNSNQVNTVGASFSSIGGGVGNTVQADSAYSAIGGGWFNAIQPSANYGTIAGGEGNQIGNSTANAAIGGGVGNTVQSGAHQGMIGGGSINVIGAHDAVVGGGAFNRASGAYAAVPGGQQNEAAGLYSLAAGQRAKAINQGAFVWADSAGADFASTANDQFLIRAAGGVGIGTANPLTALDVNGTVTATSFTGSGAQLTAIGTSALADNSVTSAKIVDGTITSADIGDGQVANADLAANAVTTVKLADNSVTSAKIVDGTITSADIGDGQVANADLAANAVTTVKLADNSVTSAKIVDGAITSADIGDGQVANADLASDSASLQKVSGGNMAVSSSNIGIGTTSPQQKLHVVGNARVEGNGGYAMFVTNATTYGWGLQVYAGSSAIVCSAGAPGSKHSTIEALHTDTVAFASFGDAGVAGFSMMASGGVGVNGASNPLDGLTGAGVYGYFWPNENYGTLGSYQDGVYGEQRGGTTTGAGVYGYSGLSDGNGVYGEASQGSVAYAIWGKTTNANCYAGYFNGRVHVVGRLTATDKQFRIDHPLDPANKYLVHSCVESADSMNLYNGNAVLNESGEAWITLPGWFEALNRDFRYQLTAIGAPAPNLHIADEIKGNRFRIAGGAPGLKVSWQVSGVRHDAWAAAHPMVVEEAKPEAERGYFLHPELHGQTAEKSVERAHKGPVVPRPPLPKPTIVSKRSVSPQ